MWKQITRNGDDSLNEHNQIFYMGLRKWQKWRECRKQMDMDRPPAPKFNT